MRVRGHLPQLDGYRGLAVLLVLVFHFTFRYRVAAPSSVATALLGIGWCGVDLFFVLSGFLITGILLDSVDAENYFGSFYARRALRIFPLYYAVLALWFLALPALVPDRHVTSVVHPELQVWYWTYLQNWTHALGHGVVVILIHFWSLGIEEQFYLVWPLAVRLIRQPHKVAVASIALAGAAIVVRIVAVSVDAPEPFVKVSTVARMDGLALGAAVAAALRTRWSAFVCRFAPTAFASAGVLLAALAPASRGLDDNHPFTLTAGYSLFAILFAAGLVMLVRSDTSQVAQVFAWSPLRRVGKLGYGMYVFHLPISRLASEGARKVGFNPGSGWTVMLVVPAALVATYMVAALSWRFFESPILRFKDRFAVRQGRSPAAELA